MPRATRAASLATRERVVASASRLFGEQGYAAVGVAEVATDAGVTRGAVYNHFEDKAALFVEVLERTHAAVAARVEEAAAGGVEPWDALERGCLAFLRAATDAATRRILLVDGPAVAGPDAWRAADRSASEAGLRAGLVTAAERGGLGGLGADAVAAALSGAMNELAVWVVEQPDADHALGEAGSTVAALLRALRG